jgi:hypothetical protein
MDDLRLAALGQFTPEGVLTPGYGDHYLFFVGRDDVHGILMHLIGGETLGYKANEYGYDDPEYNAAILGLFKLPHVAVQVTLDLSQAGGTHEKALLDADRQQDATNFNNSFAIGQSSTHQISHTKGRIYLGQGIWCEGSTNLSGGGEGEHVSLKTSVRNPAGFKAQNNTLLVSTNAVGLNRFSVQLDREHAIAKAQMAAKALAAMKVAA